jgi:hypothetical protein
MRSLLAVAAVVIATACDRVPSPEIVFIGTPIPTAVEVRGLPASDIQALTTAAPATEQWQQILRVQVAGSAGPIAGDYSAENGTIRFTPMFGFDQGRTFVVTFNATLIPGVDTRAPWRQPRLQRIMTVAEAPAARTTVVTQVYPSAGVLPENTLRFYIEFSSPMGRGSALEHIRLITEDGKEVVDPFLPVEAGFWNPERTRFTLFFDPGRVKRGIKPNRDMGRALIAGRRYALVISEQWLDGRGQALKEEHRHTFTAGPAAEAPLTTAAWRIDTPRAGTRDPVIVTFPKPLDAGLLLRALGVARSGPGPGGPGPEMAGEIQVDEAETRWAFTPTNSWPAGEYALVVLTVLEDPAGNRIGRAFEVRRPGTQESERVVIPFTVRSR